MTPEREYIPDFRLEDLPPLPTSLIGPSLLRSILYISSINILTLCLQKVHVTATNPSRLSLEVGGW